MSWSRDLKEAGSWLCGYLGEECSKQKEQLVRKARGQRAMCMWATCRYTIMYLGFHIECEPRDRERGHAEGVG